MLEAIARRCSCRKYADRPVPDDAVEEIVQAGMRAPSAMNVRPWHIVVVRDDMLRQQLAGVHDYAGFCADSPVVLVVCGEGTREDDSWIEACSALVQNMLLQATELGLDTCWVGIRGNDHAGYEYEAAVRSILGIPDDIRVLAQISCGYAAEPVTPKAPASMEKVHHDTW